MRLFMFLAAALAVSACQPVLAPPTTPSAPLATAGGLCPAGSYGARTLLDEKRLYDAEALYNVPAHAYVTADGKGLLPASLKATVKPVLQKAYAALKLARSAYCAGNSVGLLNQYEAVKSFATQAKAMLPNPS